MYSQGYITKRLTTVGVPLALAIQAPIPDAIKLTGTNNAVRKSNVPGGCAMLAMLMIRGIAKMDSKRTPSLQTGL